MNPLIGLARRICCLLALMAVTGSSPGQSSAQHATKFQGAHGGQIIILDQNGQPVANAQPSATGQIVDVTVGPGLAFDPDTVNISVGDTVRWTWAGSGHSVTSGPPCAVDSQYCSPNDTNCTAGTLSNAGTVYMHTFSRAGSYSYFCIAHCFFGMTGVVNVSGGCAPSS